MVTTSAAARVLAPWSEGVISVSEGVNVRKVSGRGRHERLRNQRPTLVVPPDVSTSFKDIWIGNVLLLETFLLKFLPAPEPFRRKDALGWVWGFLYIYL